MKSIGCDIGSLFSKAVIMDGDRLVASKVIETTGNIAGEVEDLIDALCREAGVDRESLDGIVGTGRGTMDGEYLPFPLDTHLTAAIGAALLAEAD